MSFSLKIDGQREIEQMLLKIPEQAPKIVAAASRKALDNLSKRMAAAVPLSLTGRSDMQSIRDAIGRSVKTASKFLTEAKAGVGVGKVRGDYVYSGKKKKWNKDNFRAAPHAHLVIMGTDERFTGVKRSKKEGVQRTGGTYRYTGRVLPRPFLTALIQSSAPTVANELAAEITKRIDKVLAQ